MREQDNTIEQLVLKHGGAYVEPLNTGATRVTIGRQVWLVDEDGKTTSLGRSYGTGSSAPVPTANR